MGLPFFMPKFSYNFKKFIKDEYMKRVFIQDYKTIDFKFYQNIDDFVVVEQPIKFTNRGSFIILKVKKQKLGTWDLIDQMAKALNIYENEVGYAGLKDKNATTTQYISIPRKYSKDIKRFKHHKIKILETFLHSTKLNIGDLQGNSFEINLHEVEQEDVYLIEKRLKEISKIGMPNFFGYQRFGKDVKQNLEKANKLIYGDLNMKDRKLEKMLISAYQSDFYNRWLAKRLELSTDVFKLLDGDVMLSKKDEKFFTPNKITEKIHEDFLAELIVPTGLLSGRNVFRAKGQAKEIEKDYDDTYIVEKGLRRQALVYPKDIFVKYNKKDKKCKLRFTLPKGSYATVLIENIANKNLR